MPYQTLLLKRYLRATLLLVAGLVFTSGKAEAGCGEPMMTLGHNAGHVTPDHDSPLPKKACHGPNCSAQPAPIPAPLSVPPKLLPAGEQWATHAFVVHSDSETDKFRSIPVSLGRPIHRATSLFHPPRSV